jgi:Glycosyl transferase family 2
VSAAHPVAAILVPTHDHAATLELAVRSALEQTVAAIEVVVIGDGVGEDTREVVAGLVREDPRVRFLDLPKGPNHGEVHRGTAIEATAAEIVCYLCDDDLLLPEHVESMAGLLADADFANSQNGYLERDGCWCPYLSDLASAGFREWTIRPERGGVSLTGTAHTVAAYHRLPHGWRTTPPGRYPDHYMWEQFLTQPWVRAVTATRVTAVQFPSHLEGRADLAPAERRAELHAWRTALADPAGRARLEEAAHRALMAEATREQIERDKFQTGMAAAETGRLEAQTRLEEAGSRLVDTESRLEDTESRLVDAETRVADAETRLAGAEASLRGIGATRTWRLRGRLLRFPPLRALARLTGRGRAT